jgi:hypothetical protein
MSTGAIIGLIVAVLIVTAAVVAVELRRSRLHRQFGREYERLVKDLGSSRKAEAELSARQRRLAKLGIRPLTPEARARYSQEWASTQEGFVDSPAASVAAAKTLVETVLTERGYPVAEHDLLTVEHALSLDSYRRALGTSTNAGGASTEQFRDALLGYRAMFRSLLSPPRRAVLPGSGLSALTGLTTVRLRLPRRTKQVPAAPPTTAITLRRR